MRQVGSGFRMATRNVAATRGAAATLAMVVLLGAAASGQDVGNLYRITGGVSDNALQYRGFRIPAGKEEVLADLKGPGKVTYFYITDDTGGKLYAGLVLEVFWDGAAKPSIRVPLSDFFGAMGGRTIDYQSLPMQIEHLCYMCYLPMPFSRSARFVLQNDGDREYAQSVAYAIDWEKDEAFAAEKSRLHACWRRSNPTNGMHTLLETTGRGQYVGNFLQVFSRFQGWWGEGDTIWHVDGKAITHTPGTEDEYGACWGFGAPYQYGSSGYLENAGGQNRMYRWYLTNPARFQRSLKVEIQNQRYENGQVPSGDDYASVAFWYQDEARPVELAPFAERTAPTRAIEYKK